MAVKKEKVAEAVLSDEFKHLTSIILDAGVVVEFTDGKASVSPEILERIQGFLK